MTTSPEHEQVINPDYTVGQWSKGALSSGPTTKPVFINVGDAPLGFTVPVRQFVIDPGYTVPEIEIEGGVICVLDDPWDDTQTWDDTCFWVDDGAELVTFEGQGVTFEGEVVLN
jgi:hypothetical protein